MIWLFAGIALTLAGLFVALSRTPPRLRGLWRTQGFGFVLAVGPRKITVYEVTEVSCLQVEQLSYNWLLFRIIGIHAAREGQRLKLWGRRTYQLYADPVDALPQRRITQSTQAPLANFEVFWHTFNEHYPFFELHGVDWLQQYALYAPQITDALSPELLLQLLQKMVAPLDDTHVTINDGHTEWVAGQQVAWQNARKMFVPLILKTYVKKPHITAGRSIRYGWLADHIGYMTILAMGMDTAMERDVAPQIQKAVRRIAAFFASAQAMIVDLRFNSGGEDAVALAIADLFAPTATPAFMKQTRHAAGFTPWQAFSLMPQQLLAFAQPVYVLTSGYTTSAAEIFVLAVRQLPQVTIVGERTDGALSDMLPRTLPNGWTFTLSHQRYVAPDGHCYEQVGLEPDLLLPLDPAALLAGRDTLLEATLELHRQQTRLKQQSRSV